MRPARSSLLALHHGRTNLISALRAAIESRWAMTTRRLTQTPAMTMRRKLQLKKSDEPVSVPVHGVCSRRASSMERPLLGRRRHFDMGMRSARHSAPRTAFMTAGQEPIAPASPAPFTPQGPRGQPTLRVLKVPYREHVRRHRVHLAGRGRGEITGRWPRAAPEMTAGALFREGARGCALLPGCFPDTIPGSRKSCFPGASPTRSREAGRAGNARLAWTFEQWEAGCHPDAGEETVISHAMPGSTAIVAAQLALFFERAPYRPS